MDINNKYIKIIVMVLCVCIYVQTGCAGTSGETVEMNGSGTTKELDKEDSYSIMEANDDSTSEELEDIYGIWKIEKVAFISEMYTGTLSDGDFPENLFDPADFIGYELEYTPDTIRLGDNVYDNPLYTLTCWTVQEYRDKGGRTYPDIYDFIENEGIEVYNEDEGVPESTVKYYHVGFEKAVEFDNYSFIPVGTQVTLLSDEAMLVGIWGKILFAYKVK